jgi:hypothetical protein
MTRRWPALAALMWLVPTPAYAHTVGPGGGVEIELLLVAGAAIFFGFRAKPAASWIAMGVGVALAVAAVVVPRGSSSPSAPSDAAISIVTPTEGQVVQADKQIPVDVALTGLTIATSPTDTGGHLHVYVDGTLEQMPYTTELKVKLSPGDHEITVEYVDPEHVSYDPKMQTSVVVTAQR